MKALRISCRSLLALVFSAVLAAPAYAQEPADKPFEPVVGQAGKDVIWVPTPQVLVEKMLDMAKVTPRDYVIDLGSGDGRNVIAAAKRGARALGVEYNPNMVEYARARAAAEGVAERAQFVQGDMFEADVSKASVLALFLLTDNLNKLTPNFLSMKPGSRIVSNGFQITDWTPEETQRSEGDCAPWCTAYLYLVPARVAGTWRLPGGELTISQKAQTFSGMYTSRGKSVPIANGRLRGDLITFTAGGSDYSGRVRGDTMSGRVKGMSAGVWTATRADL